MVAPKILHLIAVLAVCSISAVTLQKSATSNWQTINVADLFSFRLPAGFARRSTKEADGQRAEYYKGETKLVYVLGGTESGAYSERRHAWMNDYEESTRSIRGKRANTRTYSQTVDGKRIYCAELNVGNWEQVRSNFT